MDRRRELKREYKESKPDMGVFMIRSVSTGRTYIEVSRNLRGSLNRARFTLNLGSHMHNELQNDWKVKGEGDFEMEVLEVLEYREGETEGDYAEELDLLRSMWKDKLLEEGAKLY